MTRTFFFTPDIMTHRFAAGHDVLAEGPQIALPWALPRTAHAAGGAISNVKDQLRYARFHLGEGTAENGTRLLRPESMALMQSPQAPAGSLAEAVGVTWLLEEIKGTRIVMHLGATKGQMSVLMMVPEQNFAISVLTNANSGGALNSEVTKWALHHYLGLEGPEVVPLEMSEEKLASYAGQYEAALTTAELDLRDGELVLRLKFKGGFPTKEAPPLPSPPPLRLAFYDKDRVVALKGPMKDARGEFLRNPDESIAWFRFYGRIHAREA